MPENDSLFVKKRKLCAGDIEQSGEIMVSDG